MKKRSLYLILSRKVTSKGGAVTPFYSGVTAPPLDVSL